jgi:membrane associated rhomboid family serine protease
VYLNKPAADEHLRPHRRIVVRARGTWFLFQLWLGGFSLVEPQSGGGIAFFAHIGGFVFGALAIKPLVPRRPPAPRAL